MSAPKPYKEKGSLCFHLPEGFTGSKDPALPRKEGCRSGPGGPPSVWGLGTSLLIACDHPKEPDAPNFSSAPPTCQMLARAGPHQRPGKIPQSAPPFSKSPHGASKRSSQSKKANPSPDSSIPSGPARGFGILKCMNSTAVRGGLALCHPRGARWRPQCCLNTAFAD